MKKKSKLWTVSYRAKLCIHFFPIKKKIKSSIFMSYPNLCVQDTTTATNSTTTSNCELPQTRYYQSPPRSVSILVYKTINSVYKSSRKIIVRVCEVASAKKVKPFKMFNLYSTMNRRNGADDKDQPKELETTGHDRFCQIRPSR